MTAGPVVIIGAGHAGFQLAASLRQHGFSERVTLLNDEGHLPYQRPPLSKAYLKGTGGPDSLMFRPAKILSRPEHRSDRRSCGIDRPRYAQSAARLRRRARLRAIWVLATGARNRLLDIPNANLDSVRYPADARRKPGLAGLDRPGQRVVVIGAGFIGLEFAATRPGQRP